MEAVAVIVVLAVAWAVASKMRANRKAKGPSGRPDGPKPPEQER